MLFRLIRKDLLLIKKYVFITMLILIAPPIFTAWAAPSLSGFSPFLYMVVFGEIILFLSISQTEAKSPKAAALLCAAPYSRNSIVKAKYVLFLLIFAYCYVAYTLVMFAVNVENLLDLSTVLTVLLCGVIICGIYLPIEFKYGLVKAKFIFLILILAFSLGPTLFTNIFANVSIDFSVLQAWPSNIKNIILVLANVVIFSISMSVSLRIYSKKDL